MCGKKPPAIISRSNNCLNCRGSAPFYNSFSREVLTGDSLVGSRENLVFMQKSNIWQLRNVFWGDRPISDTSFRYPFFLSGAKSIV